MYTKEQVDAMLSQVEQEFEKTLGSIAKNENIEEINEEAETEEVMAKSEEEVETEEVEDSYETIEELYNSMDKSEKEAHYAACKKSLFSEVEEQESEEPAAQVEQEMSKSESDKLKEENESLKKSYNELNELVNKMFSAKKAPAQKAIISTDYIAKSEEVEGKDGVDITKMSKNEITEKLKAVDQSNLTKSDRNAINDFYLKNASVDKIKHLIIE